MAAVLQVCKEEIQRRSTLPGSTSFLHVFSTGFRDVFKPRKTFYALSCRASTQCLDHHTSAVVARANSLAFPDCGILKKFTRFEILYTVFVIVLNRHSFWLCQLLLHTVSEFHLMQLLDLLVFAVSSVTEQLFKWHSLQAIFVRRG